MFLTFVQIGCFEVGNIFGSNLAIALRTAVAIAGLPV